MNKHIYRKRNFLLTFFDKDEYSEKEINDYWLIKSWDGNYEKWNVGIYTQETYKDFKQGIKKGIKPLF